MLSKLSNINRRKFLKLTGIVVLATSVAGALGGCSGGGSSTPAPPSPEEEEIAQIILDSINAARKEVGLDGTVQEVDKISQLSAQRALEMMNGKRMRNCLRFQKISKMVENAISTAEGKAGRKQGFHGDTLQRNSSQQNGRMISKQS